MKNINKNKAVSVCILRSNPVRPDSRVEKEAWALAKAGYSVHILAWDRDTNELECQDYVSVADIKIPITRLGHKATYGEGIKNLGSYLKFQFHMRKWLKTNKFDIIHACDFDTALFSRGVAKRTKAKFVFDIFDFLAGEPSNLLQYIVKKTQLFLIDSADATIICTDERKRQIAGSNPKRLTVIHNTPAEDQVGSFEFPLVSDGGVKIAYVGILQDYRLLKEIAEAVAEADQIELHIAGFGKYESYFEQMDQNHKNIHFYGRISYDQTLSLEAQCDIMLAIYDPSIENHRLAAPNKFYESLMLGKPLVMVRNTGMSYVVEENSVGVLIDYSKEGFVSGINKLIERKGEWHSIEKRMKEIYQHQHCWSEMERRLIQMYADLQNEKTTDR
ncbi:MAG: glycosyltransferase family 4 protein [Ruminococcaceae bacterium]|nr:glycosyltransferase family 4 protein [Oscillospiraceae bacterium]